jgi:UDP-N-acetylmuramate dehydrogenase
MYCKQQSPNCWRTCIFAALKLFAMQNLRPYNTFGIEAWAASFIEINDATELRRYLVKHNKHAQPLVLGGGSNILLMDDLQVPVFKNNILGKKIVWEDADAAIVEVGGGENWHGLVLWCLELGLGGIENLSLIPGTAGAAPIQNIGAYGVEIKEVLHSVEAVELASGRLRQFSASDCRLGYRDSFFKNEGKGRFFITSIQLKLSKRDHRLRLDYGDIRRRLEETGITHPDICAVSEAVTHIRQSKLPDPTRMGNAGSFFKNPIVPLEKALRLRELWPNMPLYEQPNQQAKLAAGWLIEQCGWKGKRVGNVGCHEKQALVLVNYGGATGREVWALATDIGASVAQKFGVEIAPEVNLWP